ncbi:hypothetical protein GCM10026987_36240 [Belliella aquatica]|uniref:Variable large protein n=1 Tax=Belliella aquatica TaxID=1323734 RepID=A0ABQ1LUD8_9BACT|nr:hypothetical protein GCM10010993_05900 [Belliella aquatica]
MYSKTIGCEYDFAVSAMDNAPRSGNKIKGNKEVAAIGIASVTHQVATQAVTANIANASEFISFGSKNKMMTANKIGPKILPTNGALILSIINKLDYKLKYIS